MKKAQQAYRFLKEKYKILSVKKYTTLSGTLVFFFVMSIMPFTFWFTLIVGRLPVDTDKIFNLAIFQSVKDVLLYVQREAKNATTGASVLLLVTTLYSSTNFFYQMRRSGEIIYDYHREKQAFRLRIGAFVLMLCVILMVVVFLLLLALGTLLFSRYLSGKVELLADYLLLTVLSFALVLMLNMYICPYKAPVRFFLPGTAITVTAWAVAVAGFAVYLKIGNMDKLYGALSVIIVFLLWLYVLTVCFIVGVIWNGEGVVKYRRREKKNKKSKLAHTA